MTTQNKTPSYTAKAIKEYRQKLFYKQATFNPDKDSQLIEAIKGDKTPFNTLVKKLLCEHYKID